MIDFRGYEWVFWEGLKVTLMVGLATIPVALLLGLVGAWGKLANNRFANLVARHGERFYGFGGLRRFKSKFAPEWRPRYLAAPGGVHLPAALLDVTRLISLDPRRQPY